MNACQQPSIAEKTRMRRLLDLEFRMDKDRCKEYAYFFRSAWWELEPASPLRWNWHIKVLCDELQKQAERIARREKKEYDLIINIPPGTSKSTICRRLFIPYVWTRFPWIKFISVSYDRGLSLDHAVDSRTLILSPWYQRHWSEVYKLKYDQNNKSYFKNDMQGYLLALSTNSTTIGRRCDIAIVDDPNDPKRDESEVRRMGTINFFIKVLHKRINMPEVGMTIIVQQRTHDNDLTGYLLNNFPNQYKLFCIPGEESDDISPPELRQHYREKLFDPINYPRTVIEDDRRKLGPDFSGQIMQRPAPYEGNIFKKHWWRFWVPQGLFDQYRKISVKTADNLITCQNIELPNRFEDKIISWDMGLKGEKDNDFSVGQVWGKLGPNCFLLDQVRDRWDALQCEKEARILKRKYPDTSVVKIEDAAAGSTVLMRMQQDNDEGIPGVEGSIPKYSKRYRSKGMSAAAASGNIILPHPDLFPWVQEFIDEYAVFDKGSFDDQVDAGMQAYDHLLKTRRVFADYIGKTKTFTVAWAELSSDQRPIIAQYTTRSGQVGIVAALFHQRQGILRVLGSASCGTAEPNAVKKRVNAILSAAGAGAIGYRAFQWFGNDLMFSRTSGDMAEQYMSTKIFLRDIPPGFDEPGAILGTIRRIVEQKIVIHPFAEALSQELLSWTWKTEREPEEGFYLARALCLASEAVKDLAPARAAPQRRDYAIPKEAV